MLWRIAQDAKNAEVINGDRSKLFHKQVSEKCVFQVPSLEPDRASHLGWNRIDFFKYFRFYSQCTF